jgi:hypothetical protein
MAKYCSECGAALSPSVSGKSTATAKPPAPKKTPRKASDYSKKYGKAFRSIAPKYKKKSGGWKKGGYKAAVRAAHAKAKRMR